jgi:hypothetical protein
MLNSIISLAVIALVAAISSSICAHVNIPVWMMFAGWIAFVAGGARAETAAPTVVCAVLGAILGGMGAIIISQGSGNLADPLLLLGVWVIVFLALLAQYLPFANVVIAYFVGMTTFFASGLAPQLSTWIVIGGGLLLGVLSGVLAVTLAARLNPRVANTSS